MAALQFLMMTPPLSPFLQRRDAYSGDMEKPAWMTVTEWGAKSTLLILVLLSIFSIAIIIDRRKTLRLRTAAEDLSQLKRNLLQGTSSKETESTASRYEHLLKSRLSKASAEEIDRATRSFLAEERLHLEKGLSFLATIGSNAPFVGLFGTVLGIIQAFGELSSRQTGSASVMSAISEALIATAVGLMVAIPAVVAYNLFQRKVREIILPCEILRDEFIAFRKLQD